MELSKEIETALNKQINHEMAAAYNYLAMAGWFETRNLDGFASWMKIQRQEELEHAAKLYDYLMDRGGSLNLAAVGKPKAEFSDTLDVFRTALKQEQANTDSINELYKVALDVDDYATQSFLKWFIDEQVEEEKTMNDAIGLIELAGDSASALITLNHQFGQRGPEDT
jgi:ferritin